MVNGLKVNWREIFKFLSGFAAASSLANLYLYTNNVSLSFLGYTIPPELLGVRSLVNLILFGVFFYFGFGKKK